MQTGPDGGKGFNPVLWLVIGLPLASVIAGVGLVIVAVRSGNTDQVIDKVQRTAQIQQVDLGPDATARSAGYTAVLRTVANGIEVLPVSGNFDHGASLLAILQHPVIAQQDQHVVLSPSNNGWHGDLQLDTTHDWILQVQARDGSWRILGRLPKGQHAAHLAPALAAQ